MKLREYCEDTLYSILSENDISKNNNIKYLNNFLYLNYNIFI